jgi:hypothetical protein
MTSDFDYKKYSLEKLQEWVHDALSCGEASPHEIYSAIREAVQEDYQYYKDHSNRALGLLELMSGHRPVKDTSILQCDKDDKSVECQEAWNDFWEEHYYPEEHANSTTNSVDLQKEVEEIRKAGGYEWTPEVKQDKVKKWVLPVEECKDADTDETEYFVSFPDDLLEVANLKEGDLIEWVDQGDGSYLLKKHVERFRFK